MPSPFPGMDPYLENPAYWGGLHGNMITRIQASLNRTLPPGWYAEIDEFVWLEADDGDERRRIGKPDTFVMERNGSHPRSRGGSAAAVLAPPLQVRLPVARRRKTKHVKVVAPDHSRVVTVIEVLSPSNKSNKEGREKYIAKREEYLASGVHLVEIDLQRLGQPFELMAPPPDADYSIFVCRADDFPGAQYWPFYVRDSIPKFEVPLSTRRQDGPILDLRTCLDEIYDTNRYSQRIDYSLPPVPPLRPLDAEWAADLLKKAARKRKK